MAKYFFAILVCVATIIPAWDFMVPEPRLYTKWLLFCAISALGSIVFVLKNNKIEIGFLSIAISIFVLYIILYGIFDSANILHILLCVSFLNMYYIFKELNITTEISYAAVITCIAECFIVIIKSFFGNVHNITDLNGTFDNSAGLATNLTICIPFCINIIRKNLYGKILGTTGFALITAIVIASLSRTSILAESIIICYSICKFKLKKILPRHIIIALVFIFLLFFLLMFVKSDSTMGRLQIWRIAFPMICENSLFGLGTFGFTSNYMNYQADFLHYLDCTFSMLADNVNHPLNELLLFLINYGVVGAFLLVLIFFVVIKYWKNDTAHQILIAFLCCATFSYPLRYSFILICVCYALSQFKDEHKYYIRIPYLKLLYGFSILSITSYITLRIASFHYRWNSAYTKGYTSFHDYKSLAKEFYGDEYFIYDFAYASYLHGEYSTSLKLLKNLERKICNYDTKLLLAKNYQELGQHNLSIKEFDKAHLMVPCRFAPIYGKMTTYLNSNDTIHAKKMAEEIISKKIKIPSKEIDFYRRNAIVILQNLNTNQFTFKDQ